MVAAPAGTVNAPVTAVTVTVVTALDGCESVALTVDVPPFSEIDAGFSDSVAFGAASSSVIVRVTLGGLLVRPRLSDAVPDTLTLLSGASVSLSLAVTVTTPALVVAVAAKVSVVAALSVKAVPDPGDADTVSVTATVDGRSSVAVTVATPPFSPIDDADSSSVVCGVSSSVSVSITVDGSRHAVAARGHP